MNNIIIDGYNIKDIQKGFLDIVLEVDRVCKEHSINYVLTYGTLLGAVRHSGFIPWDDDVDIAMLREDYDRFINASRTNMNPEYFLQTPETDKNYRMNRVRVRKNNTLYVQDRKKDIDIHHGLFITIFPYDKVVDTFLVGQLQPKLIVLSRELKKIIKKIFNPYIGRESRMGRALEHWMALHRRFEYKVATMFNGSDLEYAAPILFRPGTIHRSWRFELIKVDDFYDADELVFEGHSLPAPKSYHDILTNLYGDYEKLPDVNERKPGHDIIRVDLGDVEKPDNGRMAETSKR